VDMLTGEQKQTGQKLLTTHTQMTTPLPYAKACTHANTCPCMVMGWALGLYWRPQLVVAEWTGTDLFRVCGQKCEHKFKPKI